MGEAFSEELGNGMSPVDAFREVFDEEVNVTWGLEGAGLGCKMITGGACVTSSKQINFLSMSTPGGWRNFTMALRSARNHVVHEFGHAFASRYGDSPEGPYRNIPSILIKSPRGFASSPMSANLTWRQNPEKSASEVFADMFLGWVFDMWAADSFGDMRDDFMTERMPNWLIY
ncbi:MAG: hypothetical protein HBSAPP04_27610 [Ignavibacteriaceae bacterium]|nr:MAG: hypothetical protein HBSAPP04_27610 [Ignavibacteriaceae bacterium]